MPIRGHESLCEEHQKIIVSRDEGNRQKHIAENVDRDNVTHYKVDGDILTGAMIPYSLENSDAVFNLGFATACVQMLPAGVYIAMGSHVYDYDKVMKNRERGAFEGTWR